MKRLLLSRIKIRVSRFLYSDEKKKLIDTLLFVNARDKMKIYCENYAKLVGKKVQTYIFWNDYEIEIFHFR